MRNGTVIHFKTYRIVNQELLYAAEDGIEKSVPLSDINFERTRELNASASPPLDLNAWITQKNSPKKAAADAVPPHPFGDIARQLRLKGEIDPQGRAFTNDDFPKSPSAPPSGNASGVTSGQAAGGLGRAQASFCRSVRKSAKKVRAALNRSPRIAPRTLKPRFQPSSAWA